MKKWDRTLFRAFILKDNDCVCTTGSEAKVCGMHKLAGKLT